MESSHMVAQDNSSSGGNGSNQITVLANQCFDFMTEKQMTFDEFIAEQRILLLKPKTPK
jgi:hypothetical protein